MVLPIVILAKAVFHALNEQITMVFNVFSKIGIRFVIVSIIGINSSYAMDNLSAYIGAESRYFIESPLYPEQRNHSASVSAYAEYYRDFDEGNKQFVMSSFARWDSADNDRSRFDLREFYLWQHFDKVDVYAGVRKVFWGVTESVHLVDVINQTDLLENLNADEKLGQPMLQFAFERSWGTLDAFLLPTFRERPTASEKGRLRPHLAIVDDAEYESGAGKQHFDLALRWSHYVDIWDFGLSHFSGTSREPEFKPRLIQGQAPVLIPFYAQIEQSGLDVQATIEAWLWKLELVSREQKQGGRQTLAVGGFEYSFYSVMNTQSDIGVIAEYQFDDRSQNTSVGQNDVALGMRWALNDIDGSELLFIVNKDLDNTNMFASLELSRRLNDQWKIEAQAIAFIDIETATTEYDLRKDDHVQVEFRRYF